VHVCAFHRFLLQAYHVPSTGALAAEDKNMNLLPLMNLPSSRATNNYNML
jgi:hypothetical protein